jgi:hypothetical protein
MELTPSQVLFTPPSIVIVGDTNSTINVTNLVSTADIDVGMTVTGAGIPAATTVASIVSASAITLSQAATATATGVSLTFSAGQVDLGGTLGNVKVKIQYKKSPIKADQFGDTDLDSKVSGFMCTIETEVTEVKDKAKVKYIFPNSTQLGVATKALQFNTAVGQTDSDIAGTLTLHPLSMGHTVEDFDFVVYKCTATSESEYVFSPTEQTKLKIVWKVYPDLSVTPARFLRYGDKDIV